MGYREELQRLQHQFELANRAIVLISDEATVERLLAELETNIVGATAAQQHGAVNGAVQLMAKLRGLSTSRPSSTAT